MFEQAAASLKDTSGLVKANSNLKLRLLAKDNELQQAKEGKQKSDEMLEKTIKECEDLKNHMWSKLDLTFDQQKLIRRADEADEMEKVIENLKRELQRYKDAATG